MSDNVFNLILKKEDGKFSNPINVYSDKPLHDPWDENDVFNANEPVFTVYSLTELAEKLYDTFQCNNIIGKEPVFMVDGHVFAETVDTIHIIANSELDIDTFAKYMNEETIDFVTTNKYKESYYSEEKEIDGLLIKRNDSVYAYSSRDTHNYINDENHNIVFKNEEEAKAAVDYYFMKDNSSSHTYYLDKVNITIDNQPYKTLIANKDEESIKIKNKPNKRKMKM